VVVDLAMTGNPGFVRLGEKEHRGLDVDALKRDLRLLWREEGKSREHPGGVTRACHSTLALAVGKDEETDDLVADLVRLHPARVILVRTDPGRAAGDVEAWVSASCVRRPGVFSLLCSEVIQMAAGPETGARVASAIRSLCVGGLPVAALSEHASPRTVDWVDRLGATLDQVVGDSEFLSLEEGLRWWGRCVDSVGGRPEAGDLLWVRLLDWRRAIASWFDHPAAGLDPKAIREVTVLATEAPGGTLKAWLLLGWLGSRLGWDPDSVRASGTGFTLVSPQGEVRAEVVTRKPVDEGVCLFSVRTVLSGTSVTWRRNPGQRAIVVEREDGTPVFRHHQAKISRAAAVVQLLQRLGSDQVTAQAMDFATRFGRNA